MHKVLAIIILLSSSFLCLMAMDNELDCTAISYQEIIQRATPPGSLSTKLDEFFEDKELLRAFVQRENTMTNAERYELVEKYKMTKLAAWNYVFRTSQLPGFILKLGPIHWTNSFGGREVRSKEVTNKNVSRVAYQQLIEDVIKRNNIECVRVVNKYLYSVSEQKTLCDEHYAVITEDIESSLIPYEENLKNWSNLSEQQKKELRIIAQQAYMADIKPENCVFGKDGIIYFIDTEQTCKAAETDFFLNNKEQMAIDSDIGTKRVDLFRKLQEPEWFERHIKKRKTYDFYCKMGIEPDDEATVSQDIVERDQKDAEVFWFGYY